jgi:hypothetical protein
MLNVAVYIIGWALYVAAQAQNSVSSKSNSLTPGWSGIHVWLKAHAVNLATRAFFSALAFGFIVHDIATKVQGMGFSVTSTTIAGVAGYSANALLYQFFGLFPGLRVEVSDLAPPASAQVIPIQAGNVAASSLSTLPKPPGTT